MKYIFTSALLTVSCIGFLGAMDSPLAAKPKVKITYKHKDIKASQQRNVSFGSSFDVNDPKNKPVVDLLKNESSNKEAGLNSITKNFRSKYVKKTNQSARKSNGQARVKATLSGGQARGSDLNPFATPQGYEFADLTLPFDERKDAGVNWDFSFQSAFIFDYVDYIDSLILKPTERIQIRSCTIYFDDEGDLFEETVDFTTDSEPNGIKLRAGDELYIDFELDAGVNYITSVDEIECEARSDDYTLFVADTPAEIAVYYAQADPNPPANKQAMYFDINGDCKVTVNELIQAVNMALKGSSEYACHSFSVDYFLDDLVSGDFDPNSCSTLKEYDQLSSEE